VPIGPFSRCGIVGLGTGVIFLSIFGPTAARSCLILSIALPLASGSEILSSSPLRSVL